ncbi:MAG: type III-B CRISPR module-associated protein Cmr3 [Spirochaetota bacterium]
MLLKIDPLDPLFFRNGRPFTMGEDDWAENFFPPSPGVIYGALRTLYFSQHPEELPLAQTKDDPTAGLNIKLLYWLAGKEELKSPHFPLPLDIVKIDGKDGLSFRLLVLHRLKDVAANCPLPWVLKSEGEKVEASGPCLLENLALEGYLAGERKDFAAARLNDYVFTENRVGIGRNPHTLTAEEHKLYRLPMSRLKNLSLAVEYEGLSLFPKGLLRLGGEGRAAFYSHLKEESACVQEPQFQNDRYFKLYLATPAFFAGGWLPGWISKKDLSGRYQKEGCEFSLQLLAAATGKPQPVGGFNIKNKIKGPKEMRQAVPAGSVYYFKLTAGEISEVVKCFHGRSISDYRPEEGFGIFLVGRFSQESLAAIRQEEET